MSRPVPYLPDDADFRTLVEIFESSVSSHASRIAFRIKKENGAYEETSYAAFGERSRALARWLKGHGAGKGKPVALLSENRPEWGQAYFAILASGAPVVPVDALLGEAEIEHIVLDSGARLLIASRALYERIAEVPKLIRRLKRIVLFDALPEEPRRTITLGEAVREGAALRRARLPVVKPDDLAALIYTSGTTGSSKGVMLSHWNITSDVLGLRRMIDFRTEDTFLSVLPLHHTFECTAGLIIPVSRGCSITTAESLASKKIIANIRETRVTIMMGVPLLFEKMATGIFRGVSEKPLPLRAVFRTLFGMVKGMKKLTGRRIGTAVFRSLRDKAGLGSLRLLISGGAPLPPWVAHTFEHLGIPFLNGYGLTEASPVLAVNVEADIDNETVGYPVWGVELAIHEPDAAGEGELIARGGPVMQGYYRNRRATNEVLKDGWLFTGDLARFDDHGRVVICGRSKNVIVTAGGKNVYPEEIEMVLNESPYVRESLVIGRALSSTNKAEEVVAYLVPEYEYIDSVLGVHSDVTPQRIEGLLRHEVEKANQRLAQWKRIKEFVIREEEFAKTSTRKIKRYLFKGGVSL